MRQKFIEGTDEKYSIREDGQITRHWIDVLSHGEIVRSKRKRVHSTFIHNKDVAARLRINGKEKVLILKNLLYSYFIGEIPESHIVRNKNRQSYPINIDDLYLHREKNRQERAFLTNRRNIKDLTRKYIGSLLGLTVKTLPEELYQHHKKLILLKRKISSDLNLHITLLNQPRK